MLHRIIGKGGSGKTRIIINKIKECISDGQQCIVIVPEQQSVAYERKLSSFLGDNSNFVLTGDFNTNDLGALDECDGVERINKKDSPTITFPEDSIAIDNIVYSSRAWRFGNINTVTDSYSDHYMIWADAEPIE